MFKWLSGLFAIFLFAPLLNAVDSFCPSGTRLYYFPVGFPEAEKLCYRSDFSVERALYFDRDGNKFQEVVFMNEKGWDVTSKIFYPGGKIFKISEHLSDGALEIKYFNKKGELILHVNLKNGKRTVKKQTKEAVDYSVEINYRRSRKINPKIVPLFILFCYSDTRAVDGPRERFLVTKDQFLTDTLPARIVSKRFLDQLKGLDCKKLETSKVSCTRNGKSVLSVEPTGNEPKKISLLKFEWLSEIHQKKMSQSIAGASCNWGPDFQK